jgi:hypothetical protein
MKYTVLALLVFSATPSWSFAAANHGDPRFYASLARLDPVTRLDQICDYEAMLRIDHDTNPFHPDRLKADVTATPQRTSNSVTTTGAAFRSGKSWYSLSYTCRTDASHLKVTYFAYHIGKLIPKSEWSKDGLWD